MVTSPGLVTKAEYLCAPRAAAKNPFQSILSLEISLESPPNTRAQPLSPLFFPGCHLGWCREMLWGDAAPALSVLCPDLCSSVAVSFLQAFRQQPERGQRGPPRGLEPGGQRELGRVGGMVLVGWTQRRGGGEGTLHQGPEALWCFLWESRVGDRCQQSSAS